MGDAWGGPKRKRGGATSGAKPGTKPRKHPSSKWVARGVRRLLARKAGELPAAAVAAKEREAARMEEKAAEQRRKDRERKLATRYHHVRFFERRKAERRLQRLLAAGAAASEVAAAQADVEYVMHFPKGEKYVALFAPGADAPEIAAKREALRERIAAHLAGVALVADADEGAARNAANDDEDEEAVLEHEDDFFAAEAEDDTDGERAEEQEESEEEPAPKKRRKVDGKAPEKPKMYGPALPPREVLEKAARKPPKVALPPQRLEKKPEMAKPAGKKVVFGESGETAKVTKAKLTLSAAAPAAEDAPKPKPKPTGEKRAAAAGEKKDPVRTRAEGGRKRRSKK